MNMSRSCACGAREQRQKPTEKVSAVHSHKVMTCLNMHLTHRQISLFVVVAAVFGRMVRVDHGYQRVSSNCGARMKRRWVHDHNDKSKMCDELK